MLYNLLESIRFIAVLLKPFMPSTSDSIFAQINCNIDDLEGNLARYEFGLTFSEDDYRVYET